MPVYVDEGSLVQFKILIDIVTTYVTLDQEIQP
jgi:hypothetical protein